MILYGSYTSPYVRHCRIALSQSGLDWSFVDTDYAGSDVGSPAKRVPFLSDGETQLTDSSSILLHIRTATGKPFIDGVDQMEQYTMTNTAMDTAINLFLLERDDVTPANTPYLARQQSRIESLLEALGQQDLSGPDFNDSQIRLACFLDWAQFRNRISLAGHTNLQVFLSDINGWDAFVETAPSAS